MLSVIFILFLILSAIFNQLGQNNIELPNIQIPQITQGSEYCYAYWAPHGAYWQDICYKTQKECDFNLQQRFAQNLTANTKTCYRREYTDAYCVSVPSGRFRATDDFETMTPMYANVCTKKYEDCAKYERFSIANNKCERETVQTREGEGLYLSTPTELKGILTRNTELYTPTPLIKPMECTKYAPIPNQAAAFKAMKFDWERTKKWGAFIDVYGNLRANRPSCRLIKPHSAEWERYLK